MQTLEDVLELVRMAREHIECGLVDDARWMLELVEGDLADLVRADAGLLLEAVEGKLQNLAAPRAFVPTHLGQRRST